jgi:hypothetical protein
MRYVVHGGANRPRRIIYRTTENRGLIAHLGIFFFQHLALDIEAEHRHGYVEIYHDRDLLAQGHVLTKPQIIVTPEGSDLLNWAYDWYYRTGSMKRDRLIQSIVENGFKPSSVIYPL